MKSKLTLRLDDEVKERAKHLARERGTSVSKLVEDYFRLILERPGEEGESSAADPSKKTGSDAGTPFSPRIQRLKEQLGRLAPTVTMDEDTRRWIDAAAEKHA
jgi:hypothetical protein